MKAVQKASLCSGLFIAPALTEACQRGRREPQTLIKPSRAEPTAQKNTRAGDADLQLIIVAIISILINILNRRVNKNALTPRRHICCRGGGDKNRIFFSGCIFTWIRTIHRHEITAKQTYIFPKTDMVYWVKIVASRTTQTPARLGSST